jgi:hypothetical protein
LLPICSFSVDATVAVMYFCRQALRICFGTEEPPPPPPELAKARAIDSSIQFLLFWLPFVLAAWWSGPLIMLFGSSVSLGNSTINFHHKYYRGSFGLTSKIRRYLYKSILRGLLALGFIGAAISRHVRDCAPAGNAVHDQPHHSG